MKDEDYPLTSVGGYAAKYVVAPVSDACVDIMDYDLRADQMAQRTIMYGGVSLRHSSRRRLLARFTTVRLARAFPRRTVAP